MAKREVSTLGYYRRWKAAKVGLYAGKYALPLVPAVTITAINWDAWFVKTGWSLPLGFASLLISIISTIIAITKKDEVLKDKISGLFYIAAIMAVWAISFMFLANILQQMGQMLLWTVAGITAGGVSDQVNMSLVDSRITEYKGYIEENTLSKSSQRRKARAEKAERERKAREEELAEAQERATE